MYRNTHSEFILSPLTEMFENCCSACMGVHQGIEAYPLNEYIFQSLFMKMTGALEQKMKCICWEMATNDYEYRYEYLNKKNYGECSNYASKNGILNDLIKSIKAIKPDFDPKHIINEQFVDDVFSDVLGLFQGASLKDWQYRDYLFYVDNYKIILDSKKIMSGGPKKYCLFNNEEDYNKIVYRHRNRCAHNTLSYQINKPDLDKMADDDYPKENYFIRYAMLIIIDCIFIALFKEYLKVG